ncbi:hypothetical protein ILUMI_27287, partial [Ignelater luminosus]
MHSLQIGSYDSDVILRLRKNLGISPKVSLVSEGLDKRKSNYWYDTPFEKTVHTQDSKKFGGRIKEYIQHNERVMMIKLETKSKHTTIIQAYMPTTDHDNEQAEEIKHARGDENLIILGDWNAKVGELPEDKNTGKCRLGKTNQGGN